MKKSDEYDGYLERAYGIKGGQGRTPSDIAEYASYAGYCLFGMLFFGILVVIVEVLV